MYVRGRRELCDLGAAGSAWYLLTRCGSEGLRPLVPEDALPHTGVSQLWKGIFQKMTVKGFMRPGADQHMSVARPFLSLVCRFNPLPLPRCPANTRHPRAPRSFHITITARAWEHSCSNMRSPHPSLRISHTLANGSTPELKHKPHAR